MRKDEAQAHVHHKTGTGDEDAPDMPRRSSDAQGEYSGSIREADAPTTDAKAEPEVYIRDPKGTGMVYRVGSELGVRRTGDPSSESTSTGPCMHPMSERLALHYGQSDVATWCKVCGSLDLNGRWRTPKERL